MERRHFQWPWTTPTLGFKGHAILWCWISQKRFEIHSFNEILIRTYIRHTEHHHHHHHMKVCYCPYYSQEHRCMTMYVWEERLLETTREQDCFKFSLKNRERRQLSGVLWKLIPCRWTRMWKRPFSGFRPKSRLDVTRRVGGAQTKWTWWCSNDLEWYWVT